MSTIFGLHHPGNPVILQDGMRAMMSAMDYWQADGRHTVNGQTMAMGHLLLHNTPESVGEIQPFCLDEYWIAADARIDNRELLFRLLQDPPPGGLQSPDAALILHLYREKGRDAMAMLRGDFALAIWDGRRQELLCARDPMGVKNLFYSKTGDNFAFASEIRGLLAVPGADKSADEHFIDCLLTDEDPSGEQTCYASIKRLLPGQLLVFREDQPEMIRYWTPRLPAALKLRSKADYLEAFREGLKTAVSRRLRTIFPIATELSGGLDSSAVTCVAASLVDDPGRLYSFSNVMPAGPEGQKSYRDEEDFIDTVIRHCGLRHSVKVTTSGRPHPLAFHDLELTVNSGVDVYSAWWMEPLRREMSVRNCRVSLSGFGGDEALTSRSNWYYKEYWKEGRYGRFLQAAVAGGHFSAAIRSAVKSLAPALAKRVSGSVSRQKERVSYLRPDLDKPGPRGSLTRTESLEGFRGHLFKMVTRDYTWQRIQSEGLFAIPHRLEPRYPLIDLDLLEIYLSLPLDLLGHPRQDRYLFRESMRGILPETVRLRSDKLISAGVYYLQEARQNAPYFREWLAERQKNSAKGWATRINIASMVRGWDPENPENWSGQHFRPRGSFRAECLLRLDELADLQQLQLFR